MFKSLIAGAIAMTLSTGAAFADTTALHAAWDDLLGKYLVVGADGVNRFDYGALKASESDQLQLDTYLESFAELDMDTLNRDQQFAAYSNIYNALTVKHIVGRYPVKSIKSGYFSGPWKRVKTEIDGEDISLHEIEHEILREMGDARVHYVINCASYSCPNLLPNALQAETLEETLEAAAHDYINHPRGVTVGERGLQVSEIYKWFREDFGGSEAAVIDHLMQYADPALKRQIKKNPDIRRYEYDWSLNDASSELG